MSFELEVPTICLVTGGVSVQKGGTLCQSFCKACTRDHMPINRSRNALVTQATPQPAKTLISSCLLNPLPSQTE